MSLYSHERTFQIHWYNWHQTELSTTPLMIGNPIFLFDSSNIGWCPKVTHPLIMSLWSQMLLLCTVASLVSDIWLNECILYCQTYRIKLKLKVQTDEKIMDRWDNVWNGRKSKDKTGHIVTCRSNLNEIRILKKIQKCGFRVSSRWFLTIMPRMCVLLPDEMTYLMNRYSLFSGGDV